jgi:YidC/Oxa1 family membrane protein insertase
VGFSVIGGSSITEARDLDGRFIEVINSINGKLIRDGLRRIIAKGEIFYPGDVSWIALKNKYFSAILKTFVSTTGGFSKKSEAGRIFTGVKVKESIIPPNSSTVQEFVLYAGPNDLGELKKANLGLEGALNFGPFGSVSFLLLDVLKILFSLLHNWGLAIIVLTFIVSILLYPLTRKSFKSMKEIQLIQPKIEKLRLEYKDNTQKFNKEVMELYRKHKVNPFGGCLPILLQMPIFIALYQVFMRSIELRGAKFFWINDLSLPDRAPLPFSLPFIGNRLNILPLLMVGLMFLQQKVTLAKQTMPGKEEQQRAMAVLMPLLFGFIFYNLPSGLVLYWLTQTLLMTFYQWRIGRKLVTKEI